MRTAFLSVVLGMSIATAALAAPPLPAAAPDYAGTYMLADGRVLLVTEHLGELTGEIAQPRTTQRFARTNASRKFVLVPDGAGHFIAASMPLQVRFDRGDDGYAATVSLQEQAPMQALARR